MSEHPETDALMIRINEGRTYDTVGPLQEHAEKLERERDMLRKALVGMVGLWNTKKEDIEAAFDNIYGKEWYIRTPDMMAALNALQATAAKGGGAGMSDDINWLITILYGDVLLTCALQVKRSVLSGDCAEYPMEPENRKMIHALLPMHVQSCGPIVAVDDLFEICVANNAICVKQKDGEQ